MSRNFLDAPPLAVNDAARCTVLLLNLGTPDAPNASALRRYLAEFLADPRVIELPRAIWLPVLYGAILPLRAGRSAAAYREIWTPDGSPLRVQSERLSASLQAALSAQGLSVSVRLAMRYGTPSIPAVLRELRDRGLRRLLVLPLYPQYSATSTATALDAVASELQRWRRLPELRTVVEYYSEPAWIEAIANSVRRHWMQQGRGERLLFSFHGIPQRYVDAGDPYFEQCRDSARAIAARLALDERAWGLSFQSRVGREAWLQPYTVDTLKSLAGTGLKRLDVVCPGFAVDCLETLEEIAIQGAAIFREAGGESVSYVPALNDDTAHVAALASLVRRQCSGWPEFESTSAPAGRASSDADHG